MKYFKNKSFSILVFVTVFSLGCMGLFSVKMAPVAHAGPPCSLNSFSASPSTVTLGSSSMLSWSTSNCLTVTINIDGTLYSVPLTGSHTTGPISGTDSYTLSAMGSSNSVGGVVKVIATPACMNIATGGPYTHAWTSVAASSDGQKLIAGANDDVDNTPIATQITYSSNGGSVWSSSGTTTQWYSAGTSDDGMTLIAGGFATAYTSSNGGSSWTAHTDFGVHGWSSAAVSQDGTKLYVGSSDGKFYNSTDSGNTWTSHTIYGGNHSWDSIALSNDGTAVALVGNDYNGTSYIYTSTDSGSTWTQQAGSAGHHWVSVASGSAGNKLIAVANGGTGDYPFISTDGGVTWVQQTGAGSRHWSAAASSSNGSRLAVTDYGGYVYTSTDSGSTWTPQTCAGTHTWKSLDMSSSGTKLIGAAGAWDDWSTFDYLYKNY